MSVTHKKIAEAAGVSQSTVSKALSDSTEIPPETAEHIRRIAEQLGYFEEKLDQRRRRAGGYLFPHVAILVPEIVSWYYAHTVELLQQEIERLNQTTTAAVLEALNAESYRSVVEPFYETALKVKYSRDSYSGQCIDLIADSARRFVTYEYGFQWNGAGTVISDCIIARNTDFASTYASKLPGFETVVNKFMEDFEKQLAANAAG